MALFINKTNTLVRHGVRTFKFKTDPGINDLRSALERLQRHNQIVSTDLEIDPHLEIAGAYKTIGAGGTVARPTQLGPAMLFENIKGYPEARVLVGAMASRERCGIFIDQPAADVSHVLREAVNHPIPPVFVDRKDAPCQEIVIKADEPGFDIRKLLPAPTNSVVDAGPYFCLGMLHARDPETGETDATIHRICVQGKDELSIFFVNGRHIDTFREKAESQGKPLPVTINMGLDPACFLGVSFEAPTTPLGYDELSVAGAIRGKGVDMVDAVTVNEKAIARAEIVIEGELLPNRRVAEDQNSNTGRAMPEFTGYNGVANPALPVFKVKAVTMRKDAILQTLAGPGEECALLCGLPTEASVYDACERSLPGFVKNVNFSTRSGGGKLLAILQVSRRSDRDEGKARQAALIALGAYREVKNIIIVDDDVDIFDESDVLWAMTTRMQGEMDTMFVPGVIGHALDPSQHPEYDNRIVAHGTGTKTIYDATYPWKLRENFKRAEFKEVDGSKYAPEAFKN